jgi:tetratricopeptide (TPR) repeat protein
MSLGERESGTTRLEEAVAAYRAALEERPRERVPLDWAQTQNNMGLALLMLGTRENGTELLKQADAAFQEAQQERTPDRVPLDWAASVGGQGVALILIADRTNDAAVAETAVTQIETAYETLRSGGQELGAAFLQGQLSNARAIRDRLKGR